MSEMILGYAALHKPWSWQVWQKDKATTCPLVAFALNPTMKENKNQRLCHAFTFSVFTAFRY